MTTPDIAHGQLTVVLGSGLFTCTVNRDTPTEVQQLLSVLMKHLKALSTQQQPVTDQESYDSLWVTRRSQFKAVEDILKLQLLLGGPQSMHLSPAVATSVDSIEAMALLLEIADKSMGLYFGPSIPWETVSAWISGTSATSGCTFGGAKPLKISPSQGQEQPQMHSVVPPLPCKNLDGPEEHQNGTRPFLPQDVGLVTGITDETIEPTKAAVARDRRIANFDEFAEPFKVKCSTCRLKQLACERQVSTTAGSCRACFLGRLQCSNKKKTPMTSLRSTRLRVGPYATRSVTSSSSTTPVAGATTLTDARDVLTGCSKGDSHGRTSPQLRVPTSHKIWDARVAVEACAQPQYKHSRYLHADQVLPPRMALDRHLPRFRIAPDLPDPSPGNGHPEDMLNENFVKLSWGAKIGLIADLARGAESIAEGEVKRRLHRLCNLVDASASPATL